MLGMVYEIQLHCEIVLETLAPSTASSGSVKGN
jgi:hypothetical protein